MRSLITFISLTILVCACQNIDDASPSSRQSFIRLIEGPRGFTAAAIEPILDSDNQELGFVLLANMKVTEDSLVTVLTKVDKKGNRTGDISYLTGGTGTAIKRFTSANFSGYIILGDSIKLDPSAEQGLNTVVTSLRATFVDDDLNKVGSFSLRDNSASVIKTDYRASALTITDDNRVMILGTYEENIKPIKSFLVVLKNNLTFDRKDDYESLDLDHVNARSMYSSGDRVIWASSVFREQSNFTESYMSVSQVKEPLDYDNYSFLGQDKSFAFFINDIKPAKGSGYGAVGTVGTNDGTGKNLFFTRINSEGTIMAKDTLYFDAVMGVTNSVDSEIEETGESLTSTSDHGFVLAGTMLTTPEKGNGERDILLVKINSSGNVVWTKILGGVGDEVVAGIVETADNGILIYGTNTIGNYATLFLIKTDANGELKD